MKHLIDNGAEINGVDNVRLGITRRNYVIVYLSTYLYLYLNSLSSASLYLLSFFVRFAYCSYCIVLFSKYLTWRFSFRTGNLLYFEPVYGDIMSV